MASQNISSKVEGRFMINISPSNIFIIMLLLEIYHQISQPYLTAKGMYRSSHSFNPIHVYNKIWDLWRKDFLEISKGRFFISKGWN